MISSTATAPSHSRIACMHFCERKYFYKYSQQLENKDDIFAPAHMGSAMHAGLDAWHRTQDAAAACLSLEAAWGTKRFHGDWDWVTPGHANVVLRAYMEAPHTQDWEVVRLKMADLDASRLVQTDVVEDAAGFLVLAEASFVVDVPGLGPINIRPDLLLRTPSGLRVVDHKTTTSFLGSNIYNGTKYGHQLRLYAMGLAALLGEPVQEGATNAIYSGKTAVNPGFKGKKYETYVFDYSPADFEETKAWYKAGRLKMEHMEEHYGPDDALAAPQNPGSHCGYCEYSKLCSAPAVMRSGLIKMTYRKKAA